MTGSTYLNHAGTSWPKPETVRAAVERELDGSARDWPARFDEHHARVARVFGVEDPGRLLLTPGCTSALSAGVVDLPWESGDRVLSSACEHRALTRPLEQLRARGVSYEVVPRTPDGAPVDLVALEESLAREGVRLVAMTAACNVTGELLPIDDVVRLAHAHDALVLVDGAQTAGWIDYDLRALGADLFAFAGHKALQAPWGIGGLWAAEHVPLAGYCDTGSVDRAALAGLVAALDWLDAPERAARLAEARARIERIADAVAECADLALLGVRASGERLPTVAFTSLRRSTAQLGSTFAAAGVTVAAGPVCAPLAHEHLGSGPDGAVRLSAGPTSSDADVERALDVIASL